ncbi:hypothetical protein GCM10011363_20250 [Marivita lacus]|uniref:SCP domain-containing protein n=1 Tax=Marivita lacus TaxID=1323742 RepID=A0ABQ1KQN8_9RHOB|nr:CAP domain-containing protein [Marivita lacus]GGC03609.1 hypothetical protein GCM10011363_20250 [Marivita lacus]
MSKLRAFAPFALALGMLGASVGYAVAQETGDISALRQEALDLTNAARAEAGLSELGPSELLNEVAQGHATDMLERDYYAHVTPEGETPFERLLAAGGSRWGLSGENIAKCEGCPTPPELARVRAFHEGWMQSPGHRENILSEGFDSFGFGIVGRGDEIYAVQTFFGPGADSAGDGDAERLTLKAARDLALDEINAARAAAGHDRLERSDALDSVAERVLARLAGDAEALPKNVFGLLPEGASGWTSLALQSASLGGTGATLTREDVAAIISEWVAAGSGSERSLGSAAASHFGFAAEAAGGGRSSAVAVFGGRK